MSTVKSYVKQILAQLTGDQNAVIAERNYRTAKAAIKGQIASLEAAQVKLETKVEKAKESLHKAKYPIEEIGDGESYLYTIQSRQAELDYAQQELDDNLHSVEYFKNLQEEFDKDSE